MYDPFSPKQNLDSSHSAVLIFGPAGKVPNYRPQFESVNEPDESYWAVLCCGELFIMLYKVVVTSEYVDKILKCDHSNKSYCAVLSCGELFIKLYNVV